MKKKRQRTRPALIIAMLILIAGALLIAAHLLKKGGGAGDSEQPPAPAGNAVTEILQNMSLEEKIGQVIIAYFTGPEFSQAPEKELQQLPLGGIILFSSAGNIESPAQVAHLTEQIQQAARDSGITPLFIAIDQEGGVVARLTEGVTLFPGNMALGAAGSEELARRSAEVMARELRILGINFNFAPVVDVNNNPANPVIGVRSFGSDPREAARLGRAEVVSYRQEKVIATAKHFPGHGDTDVDSHYGLPLIPYELSRLEKVELLPFQAMIDAGVPAVMMGHILAPGITGSEELPASLSPEAVRYLRKNMGFDGLVVTDSMSMGAITERWGLGEAAVMAFQAGVDIILFGPWAGVEPGDGRRIFDALKEAVETGLITRERLDQSVSRILAAKILCGLMDDPLPYREKLSRLALPENLDLARRIARESITLVRDRASVIPLASQEQLPLLWPAELESALAPVMVECPFVQPRLLPLRASDAEIGALLETLRGSPLVLAGSYNLQHYPIWAGLINSLAEEREIALIALSSPYDLLAAPGAGAYICTYSSSSPSMQALGEILSGAVTPVGRLPVDLPGVD